MRGNWILPGNKLGYPERMAEDKGFGYDKGRIHIAIKVEGFTGDNNSISFTRTRSILVSGNII